MHLGWILAVTGLHLDIFWNINQYRAGLSGARDMERHFQDSAEVLALADRNAVFRDRTCHADDIDLLEGIVADQPERHLAGNAHKRNAVIMCIRKPRDDIGRARTACNKTDAHLAGCLGIALSFKNQALLVSWKNDFNIFLFV